MIRTVIGAVEGDRIGSVLPHERVLHRIAPRNGEEAGVAVEELQEFRRDSWFRGGCNLRLDRPDDAFRELEQLVHATSGSGDAKPLVVDVTLPVEGRDELMDKRVQLAEKLGLHLVTVTTFDVEKVQVGATDEANESEQIAKTLETELVFGIGADGGSAKPVGAGAIYQRIHGVQTTELGARERTLARGLALAQGRTHAPLYLSFSFDAGASASRQQHAAGLQQLVLAWLRTLTGFGAESSKLVLCHADQWYRGSADGPEYAFLLGVFQLGVSMLFDMIGLSNVSDVAIINNTYRQAAVEGSSSLDDDIDSATVPPRDVTIAKWIARFVVLHGFGSQILLSTHTHQRVQYRRYGGGGYAYLFTFFKPRLLSLGVSASQWEALVTHNPIKLLSWYEPPAKPEIPKNYLPCSICREYFEPIEGEYFTKFAFTYCGTKCLRRHSRLGFVDPPPPPTTPSKRM